MARLALSWEALKSLGKGAPEKRVLAWYVRRRTTVSNGWLSAHLDCGHPANIPGYIRSVEAGTNRQIREISFWGHHTDFLTDKSVHRLLSWLDWHAWWYRGSLII